jgi:hypothetical protein
MMVAGMLATSHAMAAVVTATSNAQGVFDGTSGSQTVQFSALDIPSGFSDSILAVKVTVDFIKCPGSFGAGALPGSCGSSGNAYAREITLRLVSPTGKSVSLVEPDTYFAFSSGPAPGGRISVVFDDAAPGMVGETGFVGGSFYPVGVLADLKDQSVLGTWALYAADDSVGSPLGVAGFRLDVTVAAVSSVPEPAMLFHFGLAVVGIAALRHGTRNTRV